MQSCRVLPSPEPDPPCRHQTWGRAFQSQQRAKARRNVLGPGLLHFTLPPPKRPLRSTNRLHNTPLHITPPPDTTALLSNNNPPSRRAAKVATGRHTLPPLLHLVLRYKPSAENTKTLLAHTPQPWWKNPSNTTSTRGTMALSKSRLWSTTPPTTKRDTHLRLTR